MAGGVDGTGVDAVVAAAGAGARTGSKEEQPGTAAKIVGWPGAGRAAAAASQAAGSDRQRGPVDTDTTSSSLWPPVLDSPRAASGAAAAGGGAGMGKGNATASATPEAAGLATPATMRDSDSLASLDEALRLLGEDEEEELVCCLGRSGSLRQPSAMGTEATASSSEETDEEAEEDEEDGDGERAVVAAALHRCQKQQQQGKSVDAAADALVPSGPAAASCLPVLRRAPRAVGYAHAQLPLERLRPYLLRHGARSMAYGHLHRAQRHFEVPGLGVVSYCWVRSVAGRAAFVIGDPLAAPGPEGMGALLARFHEQVPGMKLYVAVSEAVAGALRGMGWSATVFGNDYYADFHVWKAPKSRRRYLNEGTNAGLVVEELREAELTVGEKERVMEISRRWLGRKKGFGGELQMMTHPFALEDEWGVRKFYCFDRPRAQGGQLLAYIFFTPCFREGKVVGYNANILRRDPTMERPSYVLDFLLLHCEKRFRAEAAAARSSPSSTAAAAPQALEFLSLSYSPLHGLSPHPGDSPYLRRTFGLWYRLPSRLYAKQGLGRHKDHFKMNRVEKVFACAKGPRALLAIQDLILTVTNLIPVAKRRHGIE